MLALRRACNPIKNGLSVKTYRLVLAPLEGVTYDTDGQSAGIHDSASIPCTRWYRSTNDSRKLFMGLRSFSSETGTKSSGEENDDSEQDFSELEDSTGADATQKKDVDDGLISESELAGEDSGDDTVDLPEDELNSIDDEGGVTEKKSHGKRLRSKLFPIIAAYKGIDLNGLLDKWVEEGNEITREEMNLASLILRRRNMYYRALQLSEWLQSTKHLEFSERDYATRLGLVAKVQGVAKAENYIQKIPESLRTEVTYRTLLAHYVSLMNVKKAEDLFKKLKDMGFPITCFACNQLLLLYKRADKKKVADVLLLMEKENVKPSAFTYKLLIDTKGLANDIHGMEQIIETMKAEGIRPDQQTLAIVARHYCNSGLKEKAAAVLKEIEGNDLLERRGDCKPLLLLYASLGRAEDVERIWKVCDSNPRLQEYMAAIEAFGKLQNVEEAEAVFDKMTTQWPKLSSMHYTTLLKVYVDNKMLAKGKDLIKQMADKDFRIGPMTWDAIVKLYVASGELEKADSVMMKAAEQSRFRPMFRSLVLIMENYARRGDVHNTEKMFHRLRLAGYVCGIRLFRTLLQAYLIAKAPAYGIQERMKADNVFPNRELMLQLSHIDPFRKSVVSDLLD